MKQPIVEGFNPYTTIERLRNGNTLTIHTIPGEEWTLSCSLHKTLLVDVYQLSGSIKGRPCFYRCGRLGEIFIKLLRYGHKAKYIRHNPTSQDEKVTTFTRYFKKASLSSTFEEDARMRLRDGDILFLAIPGEYWRLSHTYYGSSPWHAGNLFYLEKMRRDGDVLTFNIPDPCVFKGTKLEHVLFEFLCQQSTFVEKSPSKVLDFKKQEVAQ